MSSEGDNAKNPSSEVDEKSENDSVDSSPSKEDKADKAEIEKDEEKPKVENSKSKVEDEESDKVNDKAEAKSEENSTDKKEDEKDEKKKETKKDDTEGEGSDKEDGSGEDDKKDVPLLDQPLEKSGPRERKKVQRFDEDFPTEAKEGKFEIPNGSGTQLGEIPRIDASISRFKNDDLKLLHRLLFKVSGKTTLVKKNIKKFNGFDFKKDSEEYQKKVAAAQKFDLKQLKSICEMLDLEKKGNKEEISERVVEFLLEPKDSGKPVGGGRPKRTAAVRANNRGYSSHDDSYSSDEKHAKRARRDKGRRPNLKDESSSESDADFKPPDDNDEKPKSKRGRKKAQSDDEVSDGNESGGGGAAGSSDESDDEPKNKKKRGNKVANNKSKTPSKRGRKPAAASAKKAAPTPKKGRKRKEESSDEEADNKEDDGSSSEDEPLAKKTKTAQPPTDDEIKSYVKEILDGANLEEITMKTVCKQVYAHYPDFDLAHKKDFIKTTVKSLIST